VFKSYRRELGLILAWLLFPLVPVVLEDIYYSISNLNFGGTASGGPDPHMWNWLVWVIILGPLMGYGFLAGATLRVADGPAQPRRWIRNLLRRRAVWVAIGPWWGALGCIAVFFGLTYVEQLFPGLVGWNPQVPAFLTGTWAEVVVRWAVGTMLVLIWAYAWLLPGWFSLRRAARIGNWRRSLVRGLIMAGAFVGSLFGSFWAATSMWRSYFFDSRVVPLVLAALCLAAICGCSNTITYGEMRRRELFHAMLVAWVLGLALMWRWWGRERPRRSPDSAGDSNNSR
jgi:hypothetical protein